MKIGMIAECQKDGPDLKVFTHLAKMLDKDIEVEGVPLAGKSNLMAESGKATSNLIAGGCQKVIILWDYRPFWGGEGCLKQDRDKIRASISATDFSKVALVCVHAMLEAWLLADSRALNSYFQSVNSRAKKVLDNKIPEDSSQPKKDLDRIFRTHAGRPYNGSTHAEKIITKLPDLKILRKKCKSFHRFEGIVTGTDWRPLR